jgi:putative flippase GtrA
LTVDVTYVTIQPMTTHVDHAAPSMRWGTLRGPFLRFLVAGATNTLLTGLLMILIAQWMDIEVAYTIVFVVGLAFTTMVTGRFVFRAKLTSRTLKRFVTWYLCVYLVGVVIAHLVGDQWGVSHVWTTGAVLAVTAPLNFLGGSRIFAVRTIQPYA